MLNILFERYLIFDTGHICDSYLFRLFGYPLLLYHEKQYLQKMLWKQTVNRVPNDTTFEYHSRFATIVAQDTIWYQTIMNTIIWCTITQRSRRSEDGRTQSQRRGGFQGPLRAQELLVVSVQRMPLYSNGICCDFPQAFMANRSRNPAPMQFLLPKTLEAKERGSLQLLVN